VIWLGRFDLHFLGYSFYFGRDDSLGVILPIMGETIAFNIAQLMSNFEKLKD